MLNCNNAERQSGLLFRADSCCSIVMLDVMLFGALQTTLEKRVKLFRSWFGDRFSI